jgi:acylphosphatase
MKKARAILHITIRGRVQGVGYRAWVESQVGVCGLEGWVRNRSDGSVEAVFAGSPKLAAEMVALCRHGPPSAKVEAVLNEATNHDLLGMRRAGERFSVLPTA